MEDDKILRTIHSEEGSEDGERERVEDDKILITLI